MNHHDAEEAIRSLLDLSPEHPSGPCPDANETAAYLEARLNPAESARWEAHAADCASCREVLALSLRLGEDEPKNVKATSPVSGSFSYRTSPFRLVFAGAVLVVVGVMLFQATREAPVTKQTPQVAAGPDRRNVSGGSEASMRAATPTQAVAGSAPAPAPRLSESMRAQAGTADAPGSASAKPAPPAAPAPALALEAGNLPRPQPGVVSDAERRALEDRFADAIKARQAAAEDPTAKMKALARPEEAKSQAVQASQVSNQFTFPGIQNTLPSVQNTISQTQNVLPPSQIDAKNQAAIPTGQVTQQAVPVTQQAAPDRVGVAEAQQVRQSQAAQKAGAGGQPTLKSEAMQMRRMNFPDADLIVGALSEARTAQLKSAGGQGAQKVGSRLFYRTANFWVDAESLAHADASVRAIDRNGKECQEIMAKEPAFAQIGLTGTPILVYWNGTNLLIR